ncbi:hypothetical protein HDU67_007336 [Dinochytrium kinnereticum]|nr:hypothetical protein HDU67_007336 [Dinochytrium kinnereticum]
MTWTQRLRDFKPTEKVISRPDMPRLHRVPHGIITSPLPRSRTTIPPTTTTRSTHTLKTHPSLRASTPQRFLSASTQSWKRWIPSWLSRSTPPPTAPPAPAPPKKRPMTSTTPPPLHFPCVDKNHAREQRLRESLQSVPLSSTVTPNTDGPEPAYGKIVSGFKSYRSDRPFRFVHGGVVGGFTLAYETWGTVNEKKDNVILLCTGLSGSSHARSHEGNEGAGWWEKFIGPGYPLDTNRFHIICTNVIGGCYGSTGPSSTMEGGEKYATRFPIVTIWDMMRAQFRMLDDMGIGKLHAVVGSSMGGMQSLAAAALYPDRVGRVISISAAARSHPYSIAMRYSQRQVLMSDPNWARGFYYDGIPPHVGMKLARQIATITYRSGPEWEERFGRKKADPNGQPAMCADFLIESYLDHQGEKWCLQYDANSFIYISKAMDMFDMSDEKMYETVHQLDILEEGERPVIDEDLIRDPSESQAVIRRLNRSTTALSNLESLRRPAAAGSSCAVAAPKEDAGISAAARDVMRREGERRELVRGLSRVTMPALVLGVQSDILFPCWQQREIAECLREGGNRDVTFYELDAIYGHDTFLIDRTNVGGAVKGHLENVILH